MKLCSNKKGPKKDKRRAKANAGSGGEAGELPSAGRTFRCRGNQALEGKAQGQPRKTVKHILLAGRVTPPMQRATDRT